jgi:hypothetical protein
MLKIYQQHINCCSTDIKIPWSLLICALKTLLSLLVQFPKSSSHISGFSFLINYETQVAFNNEAVTKHNTHLIFNFN